MHSAACHSHTMHEVNATTYEYDPIFNTVNKFKLG